MNVYLDFIPLIPAQDVGVASVPLQVVVLPLQLNYGFIKLTSTNQRFSLNKYLGVPLLKKKKIIFDSQLLLIFLEVQKIKIRLFKIIRKLFFITLLLKSLHTQFIC
jgi:hypothetical protein